MIKLYQSLKIFSLVILLFLGSGVLRAQNDLIISAAYDGPLTGGLPKGVEIYVINTVADLSVYAIGSANNGGGTDGPEYTLSGSATAGDYIYIASEATEFNNWFGFAANLTTSVMGINGDDAIELFYDATGAFAGGETPIDVFGDINVDGNGETWEYLDGWAYRKDGGSASSTFTDTDWTYSGANALDLESTNGTAASPIPIGTYSHAAACTAPSTQASAISFTSVGDNGITVNWTAGDGDDGVIVLAKEGVAVDTEPTGGVSYTGNAAFSTGDEIGTGNYVVYVGGAAGADNVAVTGLTQGTTYQFAVYELNTTDVCYLTPGLTGSQATTSSVDSDSDITVPTAQVTGGTISSFVDTGGEAVDVFTFKITDAGSGDGLATILNGVVIEKGTNNNVADWSAVIAGAILNDGSSDLTATSVTINADNITFDYTGNEYSVADGTPEELILSIYLNTSVIDDEILEFEIPDVHSVSDDANGSQIIATLAGAVTSNQFTVDVTAIEYTIETPTKTAANYDFIVTATAVDANANVDLAARNVTLSRNGGSGALTSVGGLGPVAMTSGVYSWSDVQHNTEEFITVDVTDGGVASTSASFEIGGPATLISEGFEGGTTNPAGWSNNSAYYNGGTSNSGSNKAGMNAADDWIQTDIQTNLGTLDFYARASGSTSNFTIEVQTSTDGSNWDTQATISADGSNSGDITNSYSLFSFDLNLEGDYYVRWFETARSGGSFYLDDVLLVNFTPCTHPSTQATVVTFGTTDNVSMVVNWTQGDGTDAIVLVKEVSVVDSDPVSGTAYSADAAFTSGTQIGTGNYVVFAGASATQSVTVTGLTQGTTYHVAVYEYNSSDDCYNTDTPAIGNKITTTPNDSDSDISANAGTTSNIDYAAFQDANTLTTSNSASLFTFSINDKGTADVAATTLTDISLDITNHASIRTLALFEGANTSATVELDVATNIATNTLSFSGLTLAAASGLSNDITVRATFLETVTDQQQIQLSISVAIADAVGSVFDASDGGGAASSIATADLNAIEVTATKFTIVAPSSATPSTDFNISATAVDANGNSDVAARNVTLNLKTGAGILTSVGGLGPVAMNSGVYSWADAQHDTEETITVDVTDGGITSTSGDISVSAISSSLEDFTNSNATSSYTDNSFVGNNSITWTYVQSRDGNGDANTSGISLPALMLRRVSDNSSITSSIISDGIGDFSVKLYKGFTGGGDRQVELFINDVSKGTSTIFDDFDEHVFEVNGLDIAGDVVIKIVNLTEKQIIIDDIEWTGVDSSAPNISVDPTGFSGLFGAITENTTSSSRSFKVSGKNLTEDITITAPSNFYVSLDDASFSASVTLPQNVGIVGNTTVHVQFVPTAVEAYAGDILISSTGANDRTVEVTGAGLDLNVIYYEDFSGCEISNYNTISNTGDQLWSCTANGKTGEGARMSGFDVDAFTEAENEDWLITPAVDLSSATNATLTFVSDLMYDTAPSLEILASSDYTGSGDPTTSTWVALSALLDQDSDEFDTWTASGDLDLTSYVGGSVYIAFKYTSTIDSAPTWTIDDLRIEDRPSVASPIFTITQALTDFGSVDNGSVSTSQSFAVEGTDLVADVTVTAPANFEVSLDNSAFSGAVSLSPSVGSLTSTTVHIRFAPTSGINGDLTGNITLATTNANDQEVPLTGTETGNTAIANDLFFSEYIEGTGSNKAIEIYNGTGAAVDLSNYVLKQSHSGIGFDNDPVADVYNLALSGTLADGDVYVIYNGEAVNPTVIAEGDLSLTYADTGDGVRVAAFNGDDALGLFKEGVIIDLIGDPGNAPGSGAWEVAGVADATVGHILVRKHSVTTGNVTPLGSFGTNSTDSEWEVIVTDVGDATEVTTIGNHEAADPVEPGFTLNSSDFNGDFGSVAVNEVSTSSSYIVSGTAITGDFTIAIPAGFEASLTSDFSNKVGNSTLPLSITPADGNIDKVTVYVRFSPDAAGSFGGDLVNSAAGYADVDLTISGTATEDTALGIEDMMKHNISVYPNPVSNAITINIPQSFGSGDIKLINLEGVTVKQGSIGTTQGFDVSSLKGGIYMMVISNQQTVITHRVIVK